jgi:hypothetical protein
MNQYFNLRIKSVSPGKFLRLTTLYLVISLAAFIIPQGIYGIIGLLVSMGTFYLFVWLFIALTCAISKQVRYLPILTYLVLFVQAIAVLFTIPDSGYYGIGCNSKNLIQSFFDRAENCSEQWIDVETYASALSLYILLVTIFVIHVIWLKFTSLEDR